MSRALHVDLKTVHKWVARGKIRGRRTRGGHLRFRQVELIRYARRLGLPVPDAFRLDVPRVVGVGLDVNLAGDCSVCSAPDLFAAALEVADGGHDVLVLDATVLVSGDVEALVRSLRRCPATFDLAVILLHDGADARAALADLGADAVVAPGDLEVTLQAVVGFASPSRFVA